MEPRSITLIRQEPNMQAFHIKNTYTFHAYSHCSIELRGKLKSFKFLAVGLNRVLCSFVKLMVKYGVLQDYYEDRIVSYKTSRIELDDLVRAVLVNQEDIMNLYHKRARYLVVGADVQYRLTKEDPIFLEWQFPSQYEARIGYKQYPDIYRTFMGLEIIFVPWIEGMFVLPDLRK